MVAGFIADTIFFGRIDDPWQTQAIFAAYAAICFASILLFHWIETRAARGTAVPRWRSVLPIVTQFALGGFWSGFVVFYGRSAVFGVSWPFLLFLILVFLGSEFFNRYHSRLVFTSVLFFFALYSYAIFALPVYTGTMGTLTFLGSGAAAIIVFAIFTVLLRLIGMERFLADVWHIRIGAFLVFAVINIFYFTHVLPPLPLSIESAGVYHLVWRVPGAYLAKEETNRPWQVRYLGFAPTLQVTPGESLYVYGAVFAPASLTTAIVHRWQWYNDTRKQWVVKASISYPIVGGRNSGYRGYSAMPIADAGEWRVHIETTDGRLIARLPFTVSLATSSPKTETITLE